MYIHKIAFLNNISCSIISHIPFARHSQISCQCYFQNEIKSMHRDEERKKHKKRRKTVEGSYWKEEDRHETWTHKLEDTKKTIKWNFACALESFRKTFHSHHLLVFVCVTKLSWSELRLSSLSQQIENRFNVFGNTINTIYVYMKFIPHNMMYTVYFLSRLKQQSFEFLSWNLTLYSSNFHIKHAFNFHKLNSSISELKLIHLLHLHAFHQFNSIQ